ncbi:MAG: tRNA pseudouridine(55) synthase TruB [Oscillospiraceae bacterium]|jgi:tRNA pseudouridine55 synthase|nr:tRNA pseudouridine(55) synthase TruB [Oscillospiraceae bacterium]
MDGILVIDKPAGYTSHDVVARLRGLLKQRRIGHGGTLDPQATGVLPVLVGRATRASAYLLGDKEYVARIVFGVVTDTQDTSGTVAHVSDRRPSRAELEAALPAFCGEILQVPPMVSAVKVGGHKLYELARRGVTVERPPRPVTVHALTLEETTADGCTLRVRASKGTYVRTLAHDLGQALGCGAALSALRRTYAHPFSLADAVTLEDVAAAGDGAGALLRPVDVLFADLPALTVGPRDEARCRVGAPFPAPPEAPPAGALCRVYGAGGVFLLIGRVRAADHGRAVHTEKNFFEVKADG